ncbi:type II toxin-antitoxin system HipA family toxin [Chitinimonas sp. BJB300]|uniref:type II toxin-antitoxin system HipA family toxin n=1 Tax=Chitinimonas sp. BJB300 TaxID=1559339 RepID=UPI000C0E15EA|nr:HipA domain-containing protein [Chitinimonas sp. BJB300]PHV10094.1 hypothetical protein CSQ89_18065 [Chitinimonas sp. BJB300]TSJ87343.1 HipA domain-containing protein [Chitinimonas sp. BJB300]
MATTTLTLQLYFNGEWHDAAQFTHLGDTGAFTEPCIVEYEREFVVAFFGTTDEHALSARYEVDMQPIKLPHWPAFLLDILPLGFAGDRIARVYKDETGHDASHLDLLVLGGANSIGNIRVKEAWELMREKPRVFPEGFELEEVIQRGDAFMAYADENGLSAQATSGVQGEAPKILLAQDEQGRWHADSLLPDHRARAHVLVKYARGNKAEMDYTILRNEAAYMRLAKAMGIRANDDLRWENNTLIIPRFDRAVAFGPQAKHAAPLFWRGGNPVKPSTFPNSTQGDAVVHRFAQETVLSLAGITAIGVQIHHHQVVKLLADYATDPAEEVAEYIVRDLLNLATGNRDNHGRNTAVRRLNGRLELTPLYDFAPMSLDPAVITRSSTWKGLEAPAGRLVPDLNALMDQVAEETGGDANLLSRVKTRILNLGACLEHLPEEAKNVGVEALVFSRACGQYRTVVDEIARLK